MLRGARYFFCFPCSVVLRFSLFANAHSLRMLLLLWNSEMALSCFVAIVFFVLPMFVAVDGFAHSCFAPEGASEAGLLWGCVLVGLHQRSALDPPTPTHIIKNPGRVVGLG